MSRSALENELAIQLRGAGIAFEREFKFCPWRRYRADFVAEPDPYRPDHARPEEGVLVQIDGGGQFGGHGTSKGMRLACERDSHAAFLGWRVIRCDATQVKSGQALLWIEIALGLKEPSTASQDAPGSRRMGKMSRRSGRARALPARVRAAAGLP